MAVKSKHGKMKSCLAWDSFYKKNKNATAKD
jgi:hypothetical protein